MPHTFRRPYERAIPGRRIDLDEHPAVRDTLAHERDPVATGERLDIPDAAEVGDLDVAKLR
jgi:hypothetical protein